MIGTRYSRGIWTDGFGEGDGGVIGVIEKSTVYFFPSDASTDAVFVSYPSLFTVTK